MVKVEKEAKMTGLPKHKDDKEVELHEAHTPRPGPRSCMKETPSVMTVVRTPLLAKQLYTLHRPGLLFVQTLVLELIQT